MRPPRLATASPETTLERSEQLRAQPCDPLRLGPREDPRRLLGPARRFTVRRMNWRKTDRDVGGGPAPEGNHGWLRLPGSVRVATSPTADEVAKTFGVSRAAAYRQWSYARA